jgi:hypothetical protein
LRFRAASLVRFAVVGSVLCVLFLIFGISFAEQREPGWLEQGVALRIVNHLEDRLEMTVDQRTQAASILQRERPVMRAIVDRTRQEREELAAMRNFDESRTQEILERYDEDDRSVQRERRRFGQSCGRF